MDAKSRLERALETRDAALVLLCNTGKWVAQADIPFLMVRGKGFTLALRTPFQRLPKQRQSRAKASLPYGLEVYAPKRVLEIAWDDAGLVELIGYDPGEWEWAIKAGEV